MKSSLMSNRTFLSACFNFVHDPKMENIVSISLTLLPQHMI